MPEKKVVKNETEEALNVMLEFQEAANQQINAKKAELLSPILQQEREILSAIDQSYQNTIYANTTLTCLPLYSVRQGSKESQKRSAFPLSGLMVWILQLPINWSSYRVL